MTKSQITKEIEDNIGQRFTNEQSEEMLDFVVIALGNFFDTNVLVEFNEFLKEE